MPMKYRNFSAACIILLFGFFASACDMDFDSASGSGTSSSNSKFFVHDLRGTWKTNNPDDLYSGSLKIDMDRITITGYGETQTPPGESHDRRPFKDFTKGTALKGYSEDGKIFIEDGALGLNGLPYTYWYDRPPPDFVRIYFLSFNFGGRTETLRKQ